ncbi:ATP-binding protein [Candidatus Woesebacteria bacterium]|nr:ATP-binding protein [Candidatus Woesebacteria bacterium]
MITRTALFSVQQALKRQAAVALIGPRQVGKTTLAHAISEAVPSLYLDLESSEDRNKLAEPALFLNLYQDQLVILDEIHRVPELFQSLRGLIDQGRRQGQKTGRFLILGSASMDLLRQSGESLAGRIAYIDMGPFDIREVEDTKEAHDALWLRGGFPDSYLAEDDRQSLAWRRDFIRTYLEREIPQFGPRIPAQTLERLWTMLAHNQGCLLNASKLAAALSISSQSVTRYIDLLADLLLVRRLEPFHANIQKRLVKSPKTYVRDSGLVHALLGIPNRNALAGHPVVGMSWEGFVIENMIAAAPEGTKAKFYRTAAGAEIDLLLELPDGELWAIEIKHGLAPKLERGFYHAKEDLKLAKSFVIYSGKDRYPLAEGVEAISVAEMAQMLDAL